MERLATTLYLERSEGRVAYDINGNGPLVICIPGMGDLRSNYRFRSPALINIGFRVVSMDLRGHGDSDATFSAFDDVATGSDLVALIQHLGRPATLIGNSMGAGAAAWAAAEASGLVAGLVLIGPFVRNPRTSLLAMLAFRLALLRPWGPAAWKAYYASLYPGRKPTDFTEHQARIQESLRRPGHWRGFVKTTQTSHQPVEARLDEIHTPTLVVMGERDPDFRDPAAEASYIAERLGGRVVMVPGAGHYPQAEYPEVVAPAVIDFTRQFASVST